MKALWVVVGGWWLVGVWLKTWPQFEFLMTPKTHH